MGLIEIGQGFVATHVQGTDNHALAPHSSQDLPVGMELLLLPWLGSAVQIEKLRAQQPNAVAPVSPRPDSIPYAARIG